MTNCCAFVRECLVVQHRPISLSGTLQPYAQNSVNFRKILHCGLICQHSLSYVQIFTHYLMYFTNLMYLGSFSIGFRSFWVVNLNNKYFYLVLIFWKLCIPPISHIFSVSESIKIFFFVSLISWFFIFPSRYLFYIE